MAADEHQCRSWNIFQILNQSERRANEISFWFLFAVLRRIKVTFLDTIVRIEHQPLDLETGVALEVHIKR